MAIFYLRCWGFGEAGISFYLINVLMFSFFQKNYKLGEITLLASKHHFQSLLAMNNYVHVDASKSILPLSSAAKAQITNAISRKQECYFNEYLEKPDILCPISAYAVGSSLVERIASQPATLLNNNTESYGFKISRSLINDDLNATKRFFHANGKRVKINN